MTRFDTDITDPAVHRTGTPLPAGDYWVGDPCYGVPDHLWMTWLEAANYIHERHLLDAEVGGHRVVGVNTAHGDGEYFDREGRAYPVDAGLIGVVPVALVEAEPFGMHRVSFPHPFHLAYAYGVILIDHIEIDTD